MNRLLLRLQDYIGRPRHPAARLAVIVFAVVAVAAVRWAIDRGDNGFNFSPFFPVILVSSVFYGWRYGLIASLVSLVAVIWLFLAPDWFGRGLVMRAMLLCFFALTIGIILFVSEGLRRLLLAAQHHARTVETYNDELHHRTSNLVQVLVNWIERGLLEEQPHGYFERLAEQLVAWSHSNQMLRSSVRSTFAVEELVALALRPFPGARVQAAGSWAVVSGDRARAVAMALHELATNSAKYGALGGESGEVRIDWEGEPGKVRIGWLESSGAVPPGGNGTGFGLTLLAALREIEELEYSRESGNVRCTFVVTSGAAKGGAVRTRP